MSQVLFRAAVVASLLLSCRAFAQAPTAATKSKIAELKKEMSEEERACIDLALERKSLAIPRNPLGQIKIGDVGFVDHLAIVKEVIDDNTSEVYLAYIPNGSVKVEPHYDKVVILLGASTKDFIDGQHFTMRKYLGVIRKSDELKDPTLPKATLVMHVFQGEAFAEAVKLLQPKTANKKR